MNFPRKEKFIYIPRHNSFLFIWFVPSSTTDLKGITLLPTIVSLLLTACLPLLGPHF